MKNKRPKTKLKSKRKQRSRQKGSGSKRFFNFFKTKKSKKAIKAQNAIKAQRSLPPTPSNTRQPLPNHITKRNQNDITKLTTEQKTRFKSPPYNSTKANRPLPMTPPKVQVHAEHAKINRKYNETVQNLETEMKSVEQGTKIHRQLRDDHNALRLLKEQGANHNKIAKSTAIAQGRLMMTKHGFT
jgi:hypothetical protein